MLDQLQDESKGYACESLSEWRAREGDSSTYSRERKSLNDRLKALDSRIQKFYACGSVDSNESHVKHDTTHFLPLHIERGKGEEAGQLILRYLRSRIDQKYFWIAFRYVNRVIKDFSKGSFWEPPGKESGYHGVEEWEREVYSIASEYIWELIDTRQFSSVVAQITKPDMLGYHGKTRVSCLRGDGIKAIWAIMMKYRPCNSVHVRSLKHTLTN